MEGSINHASVWKKSKRLLAPGVLAMCVSVLAACSVLPGIGSSATTVVVQAGALGKPVNESLLGVVSAGPASAEAPIKALGLDYVRTNAYFSDQNYNCTTGRWNPSQLDAKVRQIEAEGAKPLVIVDYTPQCLASGTMLPWQHNVTYDAPDGTPQDQAKWDSLVYQMAYKEIGSEHVRAFEIWNEPDGSFWNPGLPAYLHLYQDTATVIEKAAKALGVSDVQIGGPAMAFADPVWATALLAFVTAHHLPLAFLSWHWYANDPLYGPMTNGPLPKTDYWYNPALSAKTYGLEVAAMRAIVDRFPSVHPKLWIDEWNVDAGYDPRQNGPYGAAFAAAVLAEMQASGLNRACMYNVENSPGVKEWDYGLLNSKSQPKPVYEAFLYWHELAGRLAKVMVDSPDHVGALASVGQGGVVHVLVWNFLPYSLRGNYGTSDPNPADRTVNLSIDGLHGTYELTRQEVDAVHPQGAQVSSARLSGPQAELSFTAYGESVDLLTLSPLKS